MRRRMTLTFLVCLVLVLPSLLLAAENEFTMRFNAPISLAGTTLKAGEYRIVVTDEATKPTVVFYDGRREVARAEGTWSNLEAAASRNGVATIKDDKGNVVVSRVLLRGNLKAVQVTEFAAKVGK